MFSMATVDHPNTAISLIWEDGNWMMAAAIECIHKGHYKLIPNRKKTGPYLLRCWLTPPVAATEDGQKGWESGNSVLLHRMFAPDDDAALHSHPWPFRTRILSGGYVEYVPPLGWELDHIARTPYGGATEGPPYDDNRRHAGPGSIIEHKATDLHAVGELLPGGPCWTMVETGPRVRSWDFFPPGKPRVPARAFLGY